MKILMVGKPVPIVADMETQGERYQYKEGEKENMAKFAVLLHEIFQKIDEAKEFADENGFGWNIDFWLDRDINGEYKVPTNYNTGLRFNYIVEDEWMSSTLDC